MPFRRKFGAHVIVVSKRNACVITEIKLSEIAMQVLLFAMLVNAVHAALEN